MDELLERIASWVRRIVKPDIDPVQERVEKLDKELDQPVPLAPEDVEMIRGLIASVEAVKKVQVDHAQRLRDLEGRIGGRT